MKPRAAWPILAKKAKEKCNEATVAVVKGRERITHLRQSIERMEMLHADYVKRSLEAEKNLMTMSEAMNSRGFLQQIRTLISRVEIDLNHAKQELEIKKNALQLAEKKRIQMETLLEQDLKRVQKVERKREQTEMDAAGVMLFNMK
jgi:flagellar export protein FliJ